MMFRNKKARITKILIILFVCVLLPTTTSIYADEVTNISLGISPSAVYNQTIQQGETLNIPLKLYNKNLDQASSVKFNVKLVAEDDLNNDVSESDWVYFSKNNFSMDSISKETVDISIKIPKDAFLGEHKLYIDVSRAMLDSSKSKTSVETHVKVPVIFVVTDKSGTSSGTASYKADYFKTYLHSDSSLNDNFFTEIYNKLFKDAISIKLNGKIYCELPHSKNVNLEKVLTYSNSTSSKYIKVIDDLDKQTIVNEIEFNNNKMIVNKVDYLLFPSTDIMDDLSTQLLNLKSKLKMDYGSSVPLKALLKELKCISNINYYKETLRVETSIINDGDFTIVPTGSLFLYENSNNAPLTENMKKDYGHTIITPKEQKSVIGDIELSNFHYWGSYKIYSEVECVANDDGIINTSQIIILNIRLIVLLIFLVLILVLVIVIRFIRKRGGKNIKIK